MHQQKLRNNRLSNLFVAYCFFQMTLANFPSLILIKTAKLYHIRVFDFEYNKPSKQTLWAWSVYFFDLIHDFCDDDQKIQRFLTFLTDNDVRHIFYLYKGKKMIYRPFVPFPKYIVQSFSFQRAYFEFSIDLKKMQFLNASQKRHKMQMLRWKATLLAISE